MVKGRFYSGGLMTHPIIKSKFLRKYYAAELWRARVYRQAGKEYFQILRFGIETGILAIQKGFMEAAL